MREAKGVSLRAALYARVSTEEQATEGFSIDAQVRVGREFCARKGWTIVAEYVDAGYSGKTLKRPDMQRLLHDARQAPKPFDVVVVHKVDRFSRSLADTITTLTALHSLGIALSSATQPIDYTTPEGKIMLMMLSMLAEIYIDNLSAETKKGKEERARRGLYNGSLPFGYMRRVKNAQTEEEKIPILHPENVEGYRLAVRMSAAGKRTSEIIAALNARGYRTTGNWGARPFGKDTLLPMLRSQFYLGKVFFKGEWLPGKHESAIDEETWRRAQDQITRRAGHRLDKHTNRSRVYVLRQMVYCAECGNRLRGWTHATKIRYYRDPAHDKGHVCEQVKRIAAVEIENEIGEILAHLRLPANWLDRALELLGEDSEENNRKEKERTNLEGQRERLRVLFQLGDIPEAQYRAERERLTAQLANLQPVKHLDIERAAAMLQNIRDLWHNASEREREDIAHALIEKIYTRDCHIVAIEPKPEFYPLLTMACAEMESGLQMVKRPPSLPLMRPQIPSC